MSNRSSLLVAVLSVLSSKSVLADEDVRQQVKPLGEALQAQEPASYPEVVPSQEPAPLSPELAVSQESRMPTIPAGRDAMPNASQGVPALDMLDALSTQEAHSSGAGGASAAASVVDTTPSVAMPEVAPALEASDGLPAQASAVTIPEAEQGRDLSEVFHPDGADAMRSGVPDPAAAEAMLESREEQLQKSPSLLPERASSAGEATGGVDSPTPSGFSGGFDFQEPAVQVVSDQQQVKPAGFTGADLQEPTLQVKPAGFTGADLQEPTLQASDPAVHARMFAERLSDEELIRLAKRRGLTFLPHSGNATATPITTSLTDVSMTYMERKAHLEKLQSQQPTVCYASPCQWDRGSAKDGGKSAGAPFGRFTFRGPQEYTYMTKDEAEHTEKNTMPSPPPCKGQHEQRVWTACNDGTMSPDGCKGYCVTDEIPGYVSMVVGDSEKEAPTALHIVTKEELDLAHEELNSKWALEVKNVMTEIVAAQDQIATLRRKRIRDDEEHTGQYADLLHKGKSHEEFGVTIVGALGILRDRWIRVLKDTEIKKQREMVAALHGVSGLCCCNYKTPMNSETTPVCKWYPFKGDIDPQSMQNSHHQLGARGQYRGEGSVTGVGFQFGHPTTIHCGNDQEIQPTITFPALFAAKDQFEIIHQESGGMWNDEKQGPFYFQTMYALDQCATDDGWQHFLEQTSDAALEFPAFDPEYDTNPKNQNQNTITGQLSKEDLNVNPKDLLKDGGEYFFGVATQSFKDYKFEGVVKAKPGHAQGPQVTKPA